MEDYFAQPQPELKKDERPELSYQVGVTLENTEKPKCAVDEPCLKIIEALDPSERPLDISAHSPDPKCRFFWKMSEPPPYETKFPGLNAPNVVPQSYNLKERWPVTMEQWGKSMKSAYVVRISPVLFLLSKSKLAASQILRTWWLLALVFLVRPLDWQDNMGLSLFSHRLLISVELVVVHIYSPLPPPISLNMERKTPFWRVSTRTSIF